MKQVCYTGVMNELTLTDSLERFFRLYTADGSARPRTLEAYRANCGYYVQWASARGINPLMATHEDILAYRSEIVGKYARATVRLRLTACRLLYRSLQRLGGRPDNPADGVRAPRSLEDGASVVVSRAVSPEGARTLLAQAPEGRDGAIIRLLLNHGLRAGEIRGLTLDDLSPDRARLSVSGKGGKRRTLVLSSRCRADMAAATPGPIFKSRRGGALSVRHIERLVNAKLEAAGIKEAGRSCHSLRHFYGIAAVMGGAGREAIADSMGHADIKTQDVYCRAAAQYQGNPADAVGKILEME